ncbi:MAG: aromatic ring-hydroxylating dioxygenase subunit alpha [Cyanobacteria bacterium P01_E01_bin.6]
MLVTQHPVFRRFWYPMMPISHLKAGCASAELLGQRLVLWLDSDGHPSAVEDRCCHRTARLSQGCVINGNIRCPYHGWMFDAEGACVEVPQRPDLPIPSSYAVTSFRCQQRYGYAWVCLDEPLLDIPEIPEATDPQFRQIHQFYEPWHCAGLRLMENSFDNAHPHFVHHKTFGIQQEPIPPQPDMCEETDDGLHMQYTLPVFNNNDQKQNLGMADHKTVRISEGRWHMPFIRTLKIAYPNGLIHLIFTAATPVGDRTSQIVQFCLRNDTEDDASTESIIAFDRAVTLEDKAILEGTEWDVPLVLSGEQHMPSDKPGIIMRHKLAALIRNHETEASASMKSLSN